jgi:hypothetical protein
MEEKQVTAEHHPRVGVLAGRLDLEVVQGPLSVGWRRTSASAGGRGTVVCTARGQSRGTMRFDSGWQPKRLLSCIWHHYVTVRLSPEDLFDFNLRENA